MIQEGYKIGGHSIYLGPLVGVLQEGPELRPVQAVGVSPGHHVCSAVVAGNEKRALSLLINALRLISTEQEQDKPVRAFLARLNGQAAICTLSKTCCWLMVFMRTISGTMF